MQDMERVSCRLVRHMHFQREGIYSAISSQLTAAVTDQKMQPSLIAIVILQNRDVERDGERERQKWLETAHRFSP